MTIAFFVSARILVKWDFGSLSEEQYALEKRSYLVMTITLFVFVVKFPLLPYFVFTIDDLSSLVPGAMCAAGVISANDYGLKLLFVKLFIVFMLILWIMINRYDLEEKNYPWFRHKSILFIVIFALMIVELWLDISYFSAIDIHAPVSCCSALFGQLEGANPLPFGMDTGTMLTLFYMSYLLIVLLYFVGKDAILLPALALFVYLAYYSVVYFFGTYIYELPTHKCPFCMLQKEYMYVGYLVWGSLFGGVFLAAAASVATIWIGRDTGGVKRIALSMITLFVFVSTAYVAVYYFKNGVFL